MNDEPRPFVCGGCDLYCGLLAYVDVAENTVVKITANPDHPLMPNSICRIGRLGMDFVSHPDRLLHPRRRVGVRGSGQWEEASWPEALDDIAARLKTIIAKDGPEAVASSIGAGGPMPHDMSRRFMNLLGSPNWTSPLLMCMGNTASVNRTTYGWHQVADYEGTKCVVLWGHDPQPKKWVGEYMALKAAQDAGARLIVSRPLQVVQRRPGGRLASGPSGYRRGYGARLAQRHHRGGALRRPVRRRLDGGLRGPCGEGREVPPRARGADHRSICRDHQRRSAALRYDQAGHHPLGLHARHADQ